MVLTPGEEQKPKLGRPPEIEASALRRAVMELQFALEQNWGIVGWLLREAKTPSDVRYAFASIVTQNCGYLEPFTEYPTCETTMQNLRRLRKQVVGVQEQHRQNYARRQYAKEKCERTFDAWSAESDPVKRAELQSFRPDLAWKFEEADSLAQSSSSELGSLQIHLRECEASFAQAEILRFLESNRRRFAPKNVALAMAGLPRVTARVSCEQCGKFGINPPDGIAFNVFRIIDNAIQESVRDLGHTIDSMRARLLYGPDCHLDGAEQLRNNWYFLESAIRSTLRDTKAQPGSFPFRIFAEYQKRLSCQSTIEMLKAEKQIIAGYIPKGATLDQKK